MADQDDDVMKHYWVSFTGVLTDGTGVAPVDGEVPELSEFLRELTRRLVVNKQIHSPLISHQGDGTLVLGSAVHAPTQGNAVDYARAAFGVAVKECGGSSSFPDSEHRSWRVEILPNATVSELVPA
jgi:hypothetical protein